MRARACESWGGGGGTRVWKGWVAWLGGASGRKQHGRIQGTASPRGIRGRGWGGSGVGGERQGGTWPWYGGRASVGVLGLGGRGGSGVVWRCIRARLCCGRPPVVVPTTHMQTAFHFLISNRTPSPLAAGAAAALLAGASTAIASVFSSAGPAERPSPAGCSAISRFICCFSSQRRAHSAGGRRAKATERVRVAVRATSSCACLRRCRRAGPGRAGGA